jgi:hypothetical protein
MNAIKGAVEAREIPFVVHFTQTTNLPSILQNGILPRAQIGEKGIPSKTNDELRLDNQLHASCFSVGFPNAKMSYKFRQENPGANWAVLVVAKDVLWESPSAFCATNAASASITCQSINSLMTESALHGMYDPIASVDREKEKLKPFDPTDVQAEVLIFDQIDPKHIIGAIFQRKPTRDHYLAALGARHNWVHADRGFFSQRWYYRGGTAS